MNIIDTKEWMIGLTKRLSFEIAQKEDIIIVFNDNTRRRWGQCNWDEREGKHPIIEYSTQFIENNINNITALKYLIIHEVCHLVHHNHDYYFESLCREWGLDGKKGHVDNAIQVNRIPRNWIGVCPNCNSQYGIFKKPRNMNQSCGKCSASYDEKYKLTWTNKNAGKQELINKLMKAMKNKTIEEINSII